MSYRIKRQSILAALTLSLTLLHGYQLPVRANAEKAPTIQNCPDEVKNAATQLNNFSMRLMKDLLKESKKDENVVISPIGIAACTAVLASGAKGSTKDELLQALSSKDSFSATECSKIYRYITRPVPEIDLSFASSIYAPSNAPFDAAFKKKFRIDFDGTMQTASDANSLSTQIIEWVKARTHNNIVLKPEDINPSDIGIINVLYFKGLWFDQFEPNLTKTEDFIKGEGASMPVDMMHKSFHVHVLYGEPDENQMIKLPYKTQSDLLPSPFSMYIILPKEGEQPEKILSELTAEKLANQISSMQSRDGSLALPSFAITVDSSLTETLQRLGVRTAFLPEADFSGMVGTTGARIGQMTQKLKLILNERGTEASVFTQAIVTLGGGSSTPFEMVVNRPFIVILRDDQSGAILLMGVIRNPERDTGSAQKAEAELTQKVEELEKSFAKKPDENSFLIFEYLLMQARDYSFSRGDFKKAKEYSDKVIALGKNPYVKSNNCDPLAGNLYKHLDIELKLGDKSAIIQIINKIVDLFFSELQEYSGDFSLLSSSCHWENMLDDCDKHLRALNQDRTRVTLARVSLLKSLIQEKAKWKERHYGAWRREPTTIGIPDSTNSIDFKQFLTRYKHDLEVLEKDTRAMQELQADDKAFLKWEPSFQPDISYNSFDTLGPKQSKLARIYIETKRLEKAAPLLELSILNLIEDKHSESAVPNVVSLIEVLKTLGQPEEANTLSETLSRCKSTCNSYFPFYQRWVKLQKAEQQRDMAESERQEREDAQRERNHEK
ncbi:MAG: serpin family protein [Cyanobacteria bacterium HKST-UBA01]|nr:serpin family protein [Cyanobacteria bacterium HKST-UBA01]